MQQPKQNGQPASNVPAGFTKKEAREKIATIEHKALSGGAVLTFIRTDRWRKNGEEYVVHVFAGKRGIKFAVWDTAVLGSRLAQVGEGETVYVCYGGKQPHPTDPKKTIQDWTVATADAGTDVTLTDEEAIDDALTTGIPR